MAKVHPDCINASNPYHECVVYCYVKIAEAKDRAAAEKLECEEIARKLKERTVHRDCVNVSNPYHACSEYCFRKIVEAEEKNEREILECEEEIARKLERTVHTDCVNVSNPYHECSEYCFTKIVEAKEKEREILGVQQEDGAKFLSDSSHHSEDRTEEKASENVQNNVDEGYPHLNRRQKKRFRLRLRMNEARKANQTAMVAEDQTSLLGDSTTIISAKDTAPERIAKASTQSGGGGLAVPLYSSAQPPTPTVMISARTSEQPTVKSKLPDRLSDLTTEKIEECLAEAEASGQVELYGQLVLLCAIAEEFQIASCEAPLTAQVELQKVQEAADRFKAEQERLTKSLAEAKYKVVDLEAAVARATDGVLHLEQQLSVLVPPDPQVILKLRLKVFRQEAIDQRKKLKVAQLEAEYEQFLLGME